MDAITLPAGTVWLDGGKLGVAIVQGDLHPASVAGVPGYPLFVAPQVWSQYDKPCETCGGEGFLAAPISDVLSSWYTQACPHCRDGRQVWTVRWPHDLHVTCRGRCEFHGVCRYPFDCPDCHAEARVTIQVVPVVTDDDVNAWTGDRRYVWVPTCLSGRAFFVDGDDVIELALDREPVPGRHWGVVLREAKDG